MSKRHVHSKSSWVWVATLVIGTVSFIFSCLLVSARPLTEEQARDRSIAAAILGESRLALGGHFYEMADTYFHRGVGHLHEEAFNEGFFQGIERKFSPRAHVHVGGRDINEIMPWLRLAIRMDPYNPELYLVAAFWLATEGRNPHTALKVLQEATAANRYCYQAQLEMGRIYLRMGIPEKAKQAFEAGLAFWEKSPNRESHDARWDRAAMLLYRALLHEADGEKEMAVSRLREVLHLFPERDGIRERIAALENGRAPALQPRAFLEKSLSDETRQRSACARGHRQGIGHSEDQSHFHVDSESEKHHEKDSVLLAPSQPAH